MNLTVTDKHIIVKGIQFDAKMIAILSKYEGRGKWLADGIKIERTGHNVDILCSLFPEINSQYGHNGAKLKYSPSHKDKVLFDPPNLSFNPPTTMRLYQEQFIDKAWGKRAFMLTAEMGLGKTKMAIDLAVKRYCRRLINQVLVVAVKGVHYQWAEHMEAEIQPNIVKDVHAWTGNPYSMQCRLSKGCLSLRTINFAALLTKKGREAIDYVLNHEGLTMLIVDESHMVKNPSTKTWKVVKGIAEQCEYRLCLTGTPIVNNLLDYWAQFRLMDEFIIGERYQSAFRAKYCVMGGFENSQIIASKNEEQLFEKTSQFTYRITKKEAIDIPDKLHEQVQFEMDRKQKKMYDQMKREFLIELDKGKYYTASNAAVALLRLQQITCGYLTDGDEIVHEFNPNPRLQLLRHILEGIDSKVIIWCRFTRDIELVMGLLGNESVAYYGQMNMPQKQKARDEFVGGKARYMVANPSSGGLGIDGFQTVCHTAIYYSNSFNAGVRWQSEDRIHRIGMIDKAAYIDIVCRGGIDKGILKNINLKRSLSNYSLDELRILVNEG